MKYCFKLVRDDSCIPTFVKEFTSEEDLTNFINQELQEVFKDRNFLGIYFYKKEEE